MKAAKRLRKMQENAQYKKRQLSEQLEDLKKSTRKPAEVQQDYTYTCARIGDLTFKVSSINAELKQYDLKLQGIANEAERSAQVWPEEYKALHQSQTTQAPADPAKTIATGASNAVASPASHSAGAPPSDQGEGRADAQMA